jgi:phage-related baseplate assembly protein
MATVGFSLTDLFSVTTKARVYELALSIASALGLPVTSWRAGDPTRSVYHVLAEEIETRDLTASAYAKSGFLDSAEGEWLTILADQVFNVQREAATAAADACVLKNTEGGVYSWDVGDLVFRSSANGKTYHNTTSGTLSTLNEEIEVGFSADEDGADSSLAEDELDEIVTAMPGVDIISSGSAIANDEEDDPSLRTRCRASTGALSPNGPSDAYRFVATSSDLTGNTETTRVYVDDESTTGDVIVYCAGSDGGVSGTALLAVEAAFARYCTPLCVTVDAQSASEVAVTASVAVVLKSTLGVSQATAQAAIEQSITDMLNAYPVGGINGLFYLDAIRGAVFAAYGSDNTVTMTIFTPVASFVMLEDDVVTPSSVSASVTFV